MEHHNININRWFWFFVTIHVSVWTLFPSLFRYTLPLDAMEGTTWGRQFAFGYDKNPFLNAWLTELAIWLGGTSGWMVYFFGQLSVALCFWAIWQLGKKILSPVHALVSVFLLECIASYNIDSIDFDDNVLELSLWAWMILCFYSALKHDKRRDWLLLGLFAGLAMMAKYYVAVLLVPMGLFLLVNKKNHHHFFKPGLYLSVIVFLLIVSPHVIWLFSHDFITIQYAFNRVTTRLSWVEHIKYAYDFVIPLIEACILPFLLFGILYIGSRKSKRRAILSYDWQFLLFMGAGPLVFTVLLSLFGNTALHAGWGMPLLSLFGLFLVGFFQSEITSKRFYSFLVVLFTLWGIALVAYAISMIKAGDTSTANYPGRMIAKEVTRQWRERYQKPLKYVVGPRWEAGVVSLYSQDRPAVYIEAKPKVSFWIDEEELQKEGAIFIWNANDPEGLPEYFYRHFKLLSHPHIESFYWMRDKNVSPIKLAIAFLPPKNKNI